MIKLNPEKLYDISINHFHKWYGLVCSFLSVWILALSVYKLVPSNNWFEWYAIGISGVSLILVWAWYVYAHIYTKRKEDKIGVVIAVHVEAKEDYNLFEKDFLLPFKVKIKDLGLPFDVVVLKNHQSEKIEGEQDAYDILGKTNSQFIVWGSVKKRKSNNQYFFNLRAMVIHSPIDEVKKIILKNDFNALLPNKIAFEQSLQPEAFEFRSNQLFSAVEYIIGRAALLSGDVQTALTLHESLYNAIRNGHDCAINIKNLEKIISLEYCFLSDISFLNSNGDISNDFIKQVENSLKYNNSNYSSLLKQAIVDFNDGSGDAKKALRTIIQAQKSATNKEWLYSKIFLHFWLEDYNKAIKECERLENKYLKNEEKLALQVCEFNENLIRKGVAKTAIYFWVGFLYYKKINNISQALYYLEEFERRADGTMKPLVDKTKGYLIEIKQQMEITE